MKNIITTSIIFIFIATSCIVSKQKVGDFEISNCKNVETIKDKDFYMFWNQLKIHDTKDQIPYKNYEIVKKRNAFDGIVFYGTFGIFSFYSVNVKACKD